ncbi:hypothetical protein BDN67DRAFT_1017117 [Paxillus ammoniavirescens]|nr:hypothetical protein BDN67DRAFT_1017117 [Paxillus ammoniavirescens]
MVKEAEQRLTLDQQERIWAQKHAEEQARDDDSVTSRGEGLSKGKQPDPCNWGGLDLSDPELDPEAQKQALRAWKDARAWARPDTNAIEVRGPKSETSESKGNESFSKVETNTQLKDEARLKAYYKKKLERKLSQLKRKADVHVEEIPTERPPKVGVAKGKDGNPTKGRRSTSKQLDQNPIAGMIDKALTKARGREPQLLGTGIR